MAANTFLCEIGAVLPHYALDSPLIGTFLTSFSYLNTFHEAECVPPMRKPIGPPARPAPSIKSGRSGVPPGPARQDVVTETDDPADLLFAHNKLDERWARIR